MSKTQFTLGIDPGKAGAIVLLQDGKLIDIWDMPVTGKVSNKGSEINPQLLVKMIEEIFMLTDVDEEKTIVAVIEKVHSMPKQGVATTFAFGKGYGLIIGVIAAHNIPIKYVTPQAWKKHFSLIGTVKSASRTVALSMYPGHANMFKLVKHTDRADALLIGLFGSIK